MWIRAVAIGLVLILAGCSDSGPTDPDPDPDPQPVAANVVLVSATREAVGLVLQRLTLQLRNEGGPGVYALEVYSLPTLDEPGGLFYGRTEPLEVEADYEETRTLDVEGNGPPVGQVLVFSRDQGSAAYRETDRFDFPPPE
jgi:hypothetical protein